MQTAVEGIDERPLPRLHPNSKVGSKLSPGSNRWAQIEAVGPSLMPQHDFQHGLGDKEVAEHHARRNHALKSLAPPCVPGLNSASCRGADHSASDDQNDLHAQQSLMSSGRTPDALIPGDAMKGFRIGRIGTVGPEFVVNFEGVTRWS